MGVLKINGLFGRLALGWKQKSFAYLEEFFVHAPSTCLCNSKVTAFCVLGLDAAPTKAKRTTPKKKIARVVYLFIMFLLRR